MSHLKITKNGRVHGNPKIWVDGVSKPNLNGKAKVNLLKGQEYIIHWLFVGDRGAAISIDYIKGETSQSVVKKSAMPKGKSKWGNSTSFTPKN